MVTTTDFQEWLNNLHEVDIEDIYCLYESIISVNQMGRFCCSYKDQKIFIQADEHQQILMLSTGKAVKAFLDKLDNDYGGEYGWVGGHYELTCGISREI